MLQICDAARFDELVCDIPEKFKGGLKSGLLAFTADKMKTAINSAMNDYNVTFLVVRNTNLIYG